MTKTERDKFIREEDFDIIEDLAIYINRSKQSDMYDKIDEAMYMVCLYYDLSDNDLVDIITGKFRRLFFEWLRRESPYMKKEAPDLSMTYHDLSIMIEYLLDEELCN